MIINLKVDQTTIGNLITYMKSQTLEEDDERRKFLMPDVSKVSLKTWLDEVIKMNKHNKKFMDVVLQL